jgi:hypothetical protein
MKNSVRQDDIEAIKYSMQSNPVYRPLYAPHTVQALSLNSGIFSTSVGAKTQSGAPMQKPFAAIWTRTGNDLSSHWRHEFLGNASGCMSNLLSKKNIHVVYRMISSMGLLKTKYIQRRRINNSDIPSGFVKPFPPLSAIHPIYRHPSHPLVPSHSAALHPALNQQIGMHSQFTHTHTTPSFLFNSRKMGEE